MENDVRTIDVLDRMRVQSLPLTSLTVSCVAWSYCGKYIAVGDDCCTHILSVATGRVVRELRQRAEADSVHDLAWSPKSSLIAVGYFYNVYVWDAETGECYGDVHRDSKEHVAWSPCGHVIAVIDQEYYSKYKNGRVKSKCRAVVRLFYVGQSRERRLGSRILHSIDTQRSGIGGIAWSPNGTFIAISQRKTVCLWRRREPEKWASSWEPVLTLTPYESPDTYICRKAAWSPCSKYLAAATLDGNLHVWMIDEANSTGQKILELPGHPGYVTTKIQWSPKIIDGKYNIATCAGDKKMVRVWQLSADAKAGRHALAIPVHGNPYDSMSSMSWSPCGNWLVVTRSESQHLWWMLSGLMPILPVHICSIHNLDNLTRHTARWFPPEARRLVLYILCVRARLFFEREHSLPELPAEMWLLIIEILFSKKKK